MKILFPSLFFSLALLAFGQTRTTPAQIAVPSGATPSQTICVVPASGGLALFSLCPPSTVTPQYHTLADVVPAQQSDGSFVIPNTLSGSTVDPTSIRCRVNGLGVTAQPSSTQGTTDYSLDPSNPLHVIPSSAAVANGGINWTTAAVRCDFGAYK